MQTTINSGLLAPDVEVSVKSVLLALLLIIKASLCRLFGRRGWIQTTDHLRVKQALYSLSYAPLFKLAYLESNQDNAIIGRGFCL